MPSCQNHFAQVISRATKSLNCCAQELITLLLHSKKKSFLCYVCMISVCDRHESSCRRGRTMDMSRSAPIKVKGRDVELLRATIAEIEMREDPRRQPAWPVKHVRNNCCAHQSSRHDEVARKKKVWKKRNNYYPRKYKRSVTLGKDLQADRFWDLELEIQWIWVALT